MLRALLLVMAACIVFTGCTVIPQHVTSPTVTYDGNLQNSGFLFYNDDGSGCISSHARDRYNELANRYGQHFNPALKPDDGITPQGVNFRIDAEHLVKFQRMNRWRMEGVP